MRSIALILGAALLILALPASESQEVKGIDAPVKRSPQNVIPMLFASLNAKLGSTIPLPTVWHTTAPHMFPDPSVPTLSPQAAAPPPQATDPLPSPPPPPPPAVAAPAAPAAQAVNGILGLLISPVLPAPVPEAPVPAAPTPSADPDPGAAQQATTSATETDLTPNQVESPTSMITPEPNPATDPATNPDVCRYVLEKDMKSGQMMCVRFDKGANNWVTSTMPAGAAERERARAKARKEEEKRKKKEEDARKKKEKEEQKKKGGS